MVKEVAADRQSQAKHNRLGQGCSMVLDPKPAGKAKEPSASPLPCFLPSSMSAGMQGVLGCGPSDRPEANETALRYEKERQGCPRGLMIPILSTCS